MCRSRFFILCQVATFLLVPNAVAFEEDTCWSNNPECVVLATLEQVVDSNSTQPLALAINCSESLYKDGLLVEDVALPQSIYLMPRFEGVQHVTLDGCHAPVSATTYGLEYLPICHTVRQVLVTRFHSDVLMQFNCTSSAELQLEILHFANNEIAMISAQSFGTEPNVRELFFSGNHLRHIDRLAFDLFRALEVIHIEEEPYLALKDADLIERTAVMLVNLSGLKQVVAALFERLPETLTQLYVAQSPVEGHDVRLVNPQQLRNVSMVGCALESFTLLDRFATVLQLNLSGNAMKQFHVGGAGNSTTSATLETLDLSDNKLAHLPLEWLRVLPKLRHVWLRRNHIATLSLSNLLSATPAAQLIDLSENKLEALEDTAVDIGYARTHTRIQIDRNPWNCKWLLYFAHTYPEKFRVFQYSKFISKINVNGLECLAESAPVSTKNATHFLFNSSQRGARIENTTAPHTNVSTYTLVYGSPWDLKRNQKAEALILVFMLPLGIALLFLLLYLWIHCQRIFHMSYYRSLPWMGRYTGTRSADRFDVVRHLPPSCTAFGANHNDGYETPMNGVSAACNCNNVGTPHATGKCLKSHHVTYEPLPKEQPHKIYEEIMEDEDNLPTVHPFYDHLSFREATPEDD